MTPVTLQLFLKEPGSGAMVKVTVEAGDAGLRLRFSGYGNYPSAHGRGQPLLIAFESGKLTVQVWTDISQPNPTHVLSMENARQERRPGESTSGLIFDVDDEYELDVCPVCCLVITRQQEFESVLIEIEGEPAVVHKRCGTMVLCSLPA